MRSSPESVEKKRMVVLKNADHMHFCDCVERSTRSSAPCRRTRSSSRSELHPRDGRALPGSHSQLATRGPPSRTRRAPEGRRSGGKFLGGDLRATLAEQGVAIDVA
jgi:hypothetical protein